MESKNSLLSSKVILPIIASILILGALEFQESQAVILGEILLFEDPFKMLFRLIS